MNIKNFFNYKYLKRGILRSYKKTPGQLIGGSIGREERFVVCTVQGLPG